MTENQVSHVEDDKRGYLVSIIIALLIVSVLLGVYYFVISPPRPDNSISISLLDLQKQASNYPEYLTNGSNSTFSVYVRIDNHMGKALDTKVLVRATRDSIPSIPATPITPITTITQNIPNGATADSLATVPLNEPGSYSVIFELWTANPGTEDFQFSNNYCVLKVQVA